MSTKTKTRRSTRYNMGSDLRRAIERTKPIVVFYGTKANGERSSYRLLDADWNRNGISGRSFYSFRVHCTNDYLKDGKPTDDGRYFETLTIIYAEPEEFIKDNGKTEKSEAFCAVTNDANLQSNYRGDNMEELAKKLVRVLERARKAKV